MPQEELVKPELAFVQQGEGSAVVLVHGFSQNSRCWTPLDSTLAASHRVVAVDLPGHGDSSGISADLMGSARLVGDTGGAAQYVGYSLGGRIVLHGALAFPRIFQKLVLIGATPGLRSETERVSRRESDELLASELDSQSDPADTTDPADTPDPADTTDPAGTTDPADTPDPAGTPDIEQIRLRAFLQNWLSGSLFAGLTHEQAHFDERMRNSCAGLASSLRLCGTGTQLPLWDQLAELEMPVLIIYGSQDDKFGAIGNEMATAIGHNASLAPIAGAGHACHLERPDEVAGVIEDFLD